MYGCVGVGVGALQDVSMVEQGPGGGEGRSHLPIYGVAELKASLLSLA